MKRLFNLPLIFPLLFCGFYSVAQTHQYKKLTWSELIEEIRMVKDDEYVLSDTEIHFDKNREGQFYYEDEYGMGWYEIDKINFPGDISFINCKFVLEKTITFFFGCSFQFLFFENCTFDSPLIFDSCTFLHSFYLMDGTHF